MADQFENFETGLTSPYENAEAVTLSDSADLPNVPRALWVGGPGDIKVTIKGGGTVTLIGAGKGAFLPIRATRVWLTGTTATSIVALW